MSVLRQGRHYLLIGILQWFLDWGVMVGLTHAGMAIEPANVIGRISGALLGFWLNGRITFAGDHHRMGRKQFLRFLFDIGEQRQRLVGEVAQTILLQAFGGGIDGRQLGVDRERLLARQDLAFRVHHLE